MKQIFFFLLPALWAACSSPSFKAQNLAIYSPFTAALSQQDIDTAAAAGFNAVLIADDWRGSNAKEAVEAAHDAGLYAFLLYSGDFAGFAAEAERAVNELHADGFHLAVQENIDKTQLSAAAGAIKAASGKRAKTHEEWGTLGYVAVFNSFINSSNFIKTAYGEKTGSWPLFNDNILQEAFHQSARQSGKAAGLLNDYYNYRALYGKGAIPLASSFAGETNSGPERALLAFWASLNGPIAYASFFEAADDPFLGFVANLLKIRQSSSAWSSGRRWNLSASDPVYADLKETGGKQVLCVINFSDKASLFRMNYLQKRLKAKNFKNLLSGQEISAADGSFSLQLQPYEAQFFEGLD